MATIGTFSKWRKFIFKKTEVTLEKKLKENIYYPFQLVLDDSERGGLQRRENKS